MKQKKINIAGRWVGPMEPPYVIAELSANHNGSLERAFATIASAKRMGADAIKLQTYTPDTMTIRSDSEEFYIKGGLWDGYSLYDLYEEAHTPFEWHRALFDKAREEGITVFSTPFDESAVELLESLDAPAYKVASFEITDLALIRCVAKTKKPMIMSTGLANLEEIGEAVEVARSNGCDQLALLHCISSYPAPPEQSNLLTIADLSRRFGVVAGLSDHTLGGAVSVASVAVGASLIEKHYTLDRQFKGPDSAFSLEPQDLKSLCEDVKVAWLSLGKVDYKQQQGEKENVIFRRSLYAVKDIKKGELLSESNVRRIRPGYGLPAKHYDQVIGKSAVEDIPRGTALNWQLINM